MEGELSRSEQKISELEKEKANVVDQLHALAREKSEMEQVRVCSSSTATATATAKRQVRVSA